jgi:enoyl-CoA hydratase/carnithine racemase
MTLSSLDREGVRLLTLDRPEALNAFTPALFDALTAALREAGEDPAVGCVVLTGAGRAFSSGSSLGDADEPEEDGDHDPYEEFIGAFETFPKPLIAAVNGLAVGIGTTLLGHCDLVLAGRSARFRMPFASLGLVPEAGSTVTMPALMGAQAAAHAFFSAAWISAEEALAQGLVWRLVDDDALLEEAQATAAAIAVHPVDSLVATKNLLLAARVPAAAAARRREDPEFRRLLAGPAHRAAVEAFLAKRG